MTPEHLKIIANMTVYLTREKLKTCEHLAIEEFAPDLFGKLVSTGHAAMEVSYDGGQMKALAVDLYGTGVTTTESYHGEQDLKNLKARGLVDAAACAPDGRTPDDPDKHWHRKADTSPTGDVVD